MRRSGIRRVDWLFLIAILVLWLGLYINGNIVSRLCALYVRQHATPEHLRYWLIYGGEINEGEDG